VLRSFLHSLALAALLSACSAHKSNAPPLGGDGGIYDLTELKVFRGLGLFGQELVLADIDGDACPDLIQSSGGMASPQPLVYYRNVHKKAPFIDRPSWYSSTIAHRGALAVGDLNADGFADLVVPVLYDNAAGADSGAIEVFMNLRGVLPGEPTYRLRVPSVPLSAALGDVDADGDLDLAVTSVGAMAIGGATPAAQHVYFNEGGTLSVESPWVGPTMAAVSCLFSDLDQDGWLDLVLGGEKVALVHGGPNAFTAPQAEQLTWLVPQLNAAFGLSASRLGGDHKQSLAVADNCRKSKCDGTGLWLFRPGKNGLPGPTGKVVLELDNGSHVRLFDGNNDGNMDLVVTQLGGNEAGGSLLLLQGKTPSGSWGAPLSTTAFLGESIAIGDPFSDTKDRIFKREAFSASIVTLPLQHVARILAVSVDGAELPRSQFSWSPGSNWIALKRLSGGGHDVSVTYASSNRQSLFVASHDPRFGPLLLYSDYSEDDR
jgi:hypothetical protein